MSKCGGRMTGWESLGTNHLKEDGRQIPFIPPPEWPVVGGSCLRLFLTRASDYSPT